MDASESGQYEEPVQHIKFQTETEFGTDHPVHTANIGTDVTEIKHKTQMQAAKCGVTAEDLNRRQGNSTVAIPTSLSPFA